MLGNASLGGVEPIAIVLAVLVVLAVVSSAYFLKARQKKRASPASSDPELPNAFERRSAHNDGLLEPELEAEQEPPTGHAGNAALGGNLSSTAQGASMRVNLKLWAWGDNGHGQVGDGTLEPRPWPVPVADFQNFTAIVAGYQRATAVRDDGTAWAWGFQDLGALGDGSDQDQPRPVPTSTLEQVVRIAGNAGTSYALRADGTVWAWGENWMNQCGDGTETDRPLPVRVHNLSEVTQIAAGGRTAYAIQRDGSLWGWGNNQNGWLGDGTSDERLRPVRIFGIPPVSSVAVGERSTYAVAYDGSVWAWGNNDRGELGNGGVDESSVPMRILGLPRIDSVAAGYNFAVALDVDGTVWSWGCNRNGQLGDGTREDRFGPVAVRGLKNITQVAAGFASTFAVDESGGLWGWGKNEDGELLVADRADQVAPIRFEGFSGARSVSVRKGTFYVFTDAGVEGAGFTRVSHRTSASMTIGSTPAPSRGAVWSWGGNFLAQLGDGTRADRGEPLLIPGIEAVMDVSSHGDSLYALREDGTVWSWGGAHINGAFAGNLRPTQLSGPTQVASLSGGFALQHDGCIWDLRALYDDGSPAQISGDADVVAIFPHWEQLYARASDGSVVATPISRTSKNRHSRPAPRPVESLSGLISLATWLEKEGTPQRWNHAALAGDSVLAWPTMGNAADGLYRAPSPVDSLTRVTELRAGLYAAYALEADGRIHAWGRNHVGQLGIGTSSDSMAPVLVAGLDSVTAIAPHRDTCFALKSDGTVWGWGANETGQLGDGTQLSQARPVQLPDLVGVQKVYAGFAIDDEGCVWEWGKSTSDGSNGSSTPRRIGELNGIASLVLAGGSRFAIVGQADFG